MTAASRDILVFVNQSDPGGHSDDIQSAICNALENTDYDFFHTLPKKPDHVFDAIIDEILVSKAVLLDGTPFPQKINPDFLILYGICYPLNKKSFIFTIEKNSCMVSEEKKPSIIEGMLHFEYYLDLVTQLKTRIKQWLQENKTTYQDETTRKPVHAFEVFGVDQQKNPSLYEEIKTFPSATDWKPRFHSNLGSFSALQELARSIGARSFNVFCLNNDNDDNMYVGIGIAIGMGRPFLIIKSRDVVLPRSLVGYNGVIEYEAYPELRDYLKQYAQEFLSENVLQWRGSTYYSILSRLETQIDTYDADELEKVETIINAVNSALGAILAQSFAILGDLYREKNRKLAPNDATLLLKAKEFYEQALRIQREYKRCEDALTVIDRHIEIINLLNHHQYRSFPRLLTLIGEEITAKNYLYIREYLLYEVANLIEQNEYANALALLAAMRVHDKSADIQKLIDKVLEKAPPSLPVELLQESHILIVELENEQIKLLTDIDGKETRIKELISQLGDAKQAVEDSKEKELKTQKEYEDVKSKLESIYAQFLSVQQTKDTLERIVTNDALRTKIETARELRGRAVVVNFGETGWGLYKALDSRPYIIRNDKMYLAYEGLVLIDGDTVRDDNGNSESFLTSGSIVIDPSSAYYEAIKGLLAKQ